MGDVTSVNVLIVAGSNVIVNVLPLADASTPLATAMVVANPCALSDTTLPEGVLI